MLGSLFALLFFSIHAFAQDLYQAGVLPLAMGGAYSAAADDGLSLYYNTAGLALVQKVEFQAFDLELGTNSDVVTGYQNFKTLNSSGNLASKLDELAGKHVEAYGADFTQLTLPYFALGLSYQANIDFNLQNTAYPTTAMQYTRDLGLSAGGAASIGKQKEFRIGMRIAYMDRHGSVEDVGITQILGSKQALLQLFNQSGTAWGATVGMQYKLPIQSRTEVTTSFVWHDIGDTHFGSYTSSNTPTPIQQNMVTGVAVRIPIGGKRNRRLERRYGPQRATSALTFAYDYTELNQSWRTEPFMMHSHAGMNLDLPVMSLQLGLYQTSLSFGTGVDLGLFKLSLATYAQELGYYPGQDRDRRYLLSISNTFGFGKF